MTSLRNIIEALDGKPVRTIVMNVRDRTVTILHNNQPIHGVTYDQLESPAGLDLSEILPVRP